MKKLITAALIAMLTFGFASKAQAIGDREEGALIGFGAALLFNSVTKSHSHCHQRQTTVYTHRSSYPQHTYQQHICTYMTIQEPVYATIPGYWRQAVASNGCLTRIWMQPRTYIQCYRTVQIKSCGCH